jgi:hypothetical protein
MRPRTHRVGVRSIASVVSRGRTADHRGLAESAGWAGATVVSGAGAALAPALDGEEPSSKVRNSTGALKWWRAGHWIMTLSSGPSLERMVNRHVTSAGRPHRTLRSSFR